MHVALGYSCRRENMPIQRLLPMQNMPLASLSKAKDGQWQPSANHKYIQTRLIDT